MKEKKPAQTLSKVYMCMLLNLLTLIEGTYSIIRTYYTDALYMFGKKLSLV